MVVAFCVIRAEIFELSAISTLESFFNNFHFPLLYSSTIAQVEVVREIGEIDAAAVSTEVESSGSKRNSTYTKWSNKDRYFTGKYTSENGVATAVWKFKKIFPDLNESTVWSFRKKVNAELKKASMEKRKPSKVIVKHSSPKGRPLILR